jgi:hypothetical protein
MLDDELSTRFKDAALEAPESLDMRSVRKRARSLLWIRRGMAMTLVVVVVAIGGTVATKWPSKDSRVGISHNTKGGFKLPDFTGHPYFLALKWFVRHKVTGGARVVGGECDFPAYACPLLVGRVRTAIVIRQLPSPGTLVKANQDQPVRLWVKRVTPQAVGTIDPSQHSSRYNGTSPPVGIIDHPSVPFPPSSVTITNAWQGYVNGDFVQVYAGSDYGNTTHNSQGWLIVVTSSPSDSISGQTYDTPGQDGPVTITAADGSNLSLTATDGAVFVFDVQTDTYDMGSPSPSPSESPTGA